jgi:hypothetical protein
MLHSLIHQLLQDMKNLNAYGLFSFFIFFSIFTIVLVWVCTLEKKYISEMGGLPLDGGEKPQTLTDKIQSKNL